MAGKFNLSIVKKKPVLIGVGVVGAILITYMIANRGGGNSAASDSGSGTSMGYTDTQVAAASQLAQLQGQLMAQGQDIQGQLALANIAANTQLAMNASDNELQETLAAMSLQASREQLAAEITGMQIQGDIQKMGLQTSYDIQALGIQSQLESMQIQAQRDVLMQDAMLAAQTNMANLSATVSLAGISAQENVARATIDATTQQIKYQNELQLGLANYDLQEKQVEADASKYAAGKSASASKSSSKWGAIASVAGAAIMMFSDINIKTIHGLVKTSDCLDAIRLMPVDYWKYIDGSVPGVELGDKMHVGTYAQDFYRELGCPDWENRNVIDAVDMMGALGGAIKELDRRTRQ